MECETTWDTNSLSLNNISYFAIGAIKKQMLKYYQNLEFSSNFELLIFPKYKELKSLSINRMILPDGESVDLVLAPLENHINEHSVGLKVINEECYSRLIKLIICEGDIRSELIYFLSSNRKIKSVGVIDIKIPK